MGSIEIEVLTEKPEQEGDIAFDSHSITRPPTYSTVDIRDRNGKEYQISESKPAQMSKSV